MTRLRRAIPTLTLAVIAYGPLLATAPGRVGADTKSYLTIDPGRLLSNAWSMWDPSVGLGTVTHQNLGYLFPLGPYYWMMETLGVADWVAQRLWLGSVLFAAGAGVRYLLGQLGWRGTGRTVAALAYMLSPYLLAYAARISVILLPWAALPWMIAVCHRALRRGGWRDPAWFALIVLIVGGVNATALVMVGLGPVLWLLYQRMAEPDVAWGRVGATVARIGLLTGLTSLWWVAGLWAQGRFGIPILRYTETYKTVADASYAQETLRGLGYWFFYGRDKLGPWIEPGEAYTTHMWLLVVSFALPVLALAAAGVVRWKHRAYFLIILAVGGLIGIGAHPWSDPSPAGAAFRDFTATDAGLALRSTPRALPLLVLATSVFLGMGAAATAGRLEQFVARHRVDRSGMSRPAVVRIVPSLVLGALVIANLPALWSGQLVADNLDRDEDLPDAWIEAAAALDQRGSDTRVLELPGSDFASYRWGNTVDPITPGLIDRPYAARELIPYGSAASADLLNSLDRPLQEGIGDYDTIAPIARLMGVGDVVLRSDLQYERYRTPRPRPTWAALNGATGLGDPIGFGDPVPNVAGPEQPLIDEIELGMAHDLADPPPVAIFPVADPVGIVRAEAGPPMVLAGDGSGLVAAAGAGLVEPGQPILYAASLEPDSVVPAGASLVITDTNRRAPVRWGTVRENEGHTEQTGEEPLVDDPSDNRLEVFPDATDDSRTVAVHAGGASARATNYGNPVSYTAGDRAINALDGDLYTAWRVGAFSDVRGERIVIDLDRPSGARRVTFVQPQSGIRTRFITRVRVGYGDGSSQEIALDDGSRGPDGQTVELDGPVRDRLEVEILDTDVGQLDEYDGQAGVGFAEIAIGDMVLEEQIRPPVDLVELVGPDLADHDLTFLFTRRRSDPSEPVRAEPEDRMVRLVELPEARTFTLDGRARVSGFTSESTVAGLIGLDERAVVRASGSLAGSFPSMGWAAFDGDPETAWQSPITGAPPRVDVDLSEPVLVDEIALTVVADGRHSVPTVLTVFVDDRPPQRIEVPTITDADEPWSTTEVTVALDEPVTADSIGIEATESRWVLTPDWYSVGSSPTPVGIAEIDLGTGPLVTPDRSAPFDTGCMDDLVTIDGAEVRARVVGTVGDVLDRVPMDLTGCDRIPLSSGSHVLRTAVGRVHGLDVDELSLASPTAAPIPPTIVPPVVTVVEGNRTSFELDLSGVNGPFWLVLAQSHNDGWTAEASGLGDLGEPQLIDGFANGWWVEPGSDSRLDITLRWWPQRVVNGALVVSALVALLCIATVAWPRSPNASPIPTPPLRPARFAPLPEAVRPERPAGGSRSATVLAALGVVGWVWVASPPSWVQVVSVVLLMAATLRARWRWIAGAAVAGIYALVGSSVVVSQYLRDNRADFDWPAAFEYAHDWGVLVLVVCGGLGVIDLWAARSSRAGPGPPTSSDALVDPSG